MNGTSQLCRDGLLRSGAPRRRDARQPCRPRLLVLSQRARQLAPLLDKDKDEDAVRPEAEVVCHRASVDALDTLGLDRLTNDIEWSAKSSCGRTASSRGKLGGGSIA